MEVSAKGEVIILNDLQASTEYTCLVSLAPSLTENETAAIKFTTLGNFYTFHTPYITITPYPNTSSLQILWEYIF